MIITDHNSTRFFRGFSLLHPADFRLYVLLYLDNFLWFPAPDGDVDGADLDLLEDEDGLLVGQPGHRPAVHREDLVT